MGDRRGAGEGPGRVVMGAGRRATWEEIGRRGQAETRMPAFAHAGARAHACCAVDREGACRGDGRVPEGGGTRRRPRAGDGGRVRGARRRAAASSRKAEGGAVAVPSRRGVRAARGATAAAATSAEGRVRGGPRGAASAVAGGEDDDVASTAAEVVAEVAPTTDQATAMAAARAQWR